MGTTRSESRTYPAEREHERVDVGEDDADQAEDGEESATDGLDLGDERHQLGLVAANEPAETVGGTERAEAVDHHRVDLRGIGRLRHAPLQNLLDLADLVAATLEKRLALAVVDPRVGRETADFGDGSAAKEEARASVGGRLGCGEKRRGRLAEAMRQVDKAVTSLDEADLVLAKNVRENSAEVVALGEHLRRRVVRQLGWLEM